MTDGSNGRGPRLQSMFGRDLAHESKRLSHIIRADGGVGGRTVPRRAPRGGQAGTAANSRGGMHIDREKCVACGNCIAVCPMGAIYVDPASSAPPSTTTNAWSAPPASAT